MQRCGMRRHTCSAATSKQYLILAKDTRQVIINNDLVPASMLVELKGVQPICRHVVRDYQVQYEVSARCNTGKCAQEPAVTESTLERNDPVVAC
jgi:hypothetical protein